LSTNQTVNLIFINKKKLSEYSFPRFYNNAQVIVHLSRIVTLAREQQFNKRKMKIYFFLSRILIKKIAIPHFPAGTPQLMWQGQYKLSRP
jgi:hypothetical protein